MGAIHARKSLSTGSHMNANTIKDLHVLGKSINTFRQFKQGEGGGGAVSKTIEIPEV